MNKALTIALENNTRALIAILSQYDIASFNHKADEDSWSPGELAEHILLLDKRINTLLSGTTAPSNRDPLEKEGLFRTIMDDTTSKIKAPSFLIPSTGQKQPEELIASILAERKKILQVVNEKELSVLLPEVPHRFFGEMTMAEWVSFLIEHTNRHLRQFKAVTQR